MLDLDAMIPRATRLIAAATAAGVKIATAESCTGGLVSALLTAIPGSSNVVECGFVTYSNEAKRALLGVDVELLRRHGAVSRQVARAMAEGALARCRDLDALPPEHENVVTPVRRIAVSITGVAGPGASENKPAGLVHFATAATDRETADLRCHYVGRDRDGVRLESVRQALTLLEALIEAA